MKIILHMGQSKTGTTALQETLNASAARLRERKILYPSFDRRFANHQLLLGLCDCANRLAPWRLEDLGGPEGAVEVATRGWKRICEDIRRTPPELLVLSSEYLVHNPDSAQKAKLAALLSELSQDITPVVYVRHPVDHYRSRLQQSLKFRDRPAAPYAMKIKESLLEIEAAFGRFPELVAFDRKLLHGGDIVCDFATRFLSPWLTPADLPGQQSNPGLSAEALVLLARLRAEAGGTYEASRSVARIIPLLEELDRNDPPSQPFTLLPEVAEAALRSASGYRWLVETGRMTIPGLDIDRIDGSQPPDWMKTAPPETLFLHDPDRLARLRAAVERTRTRGAAGKRGPLSAVLKPRLRDRLLRYLQRKLASLQDGNSGR